LPELLTARKLRQAESVPPGSLGHETLWPFLSKKAPSVSPMAMPSKHPRILSRSDELITAVCPGSLSNLDPFPVASALHPFSGENEPQPA
jgi:hypothetical protein